MAECSIKDLKQILRTLGVKEEEMDKCTEKSDLKKLLALPREVTSHVCVRVCTGVSIYGRTSISSPLPQSDAFYSRCVRMQAPSTGDEVESRLFCTESGDLMRAPAVL